MVNLPQGLVTNLEVDASGGYAGVAEQALDGDEVCAPLQQACCEGVSPRGGALAGARKLGCVGQPVEQLLD